MLDLILLIIAAVCFALVALEVGVQRVNLLGVGLFCVTLSLLL